MGIELGLRAWRRVRLLIVGLALCAGLLSVAGCDLSEATGGSGGGDNTYWYCWDSGNPDPHHLGHPVSGDHLCSQGELSQAGM